MSERNPIPPALSHLRVLRAAGVVAGLQEAAAWVEGSKATMQSDSAEYRWATGAAAFLRQLAEERDPVTRVA